MYESKRNNDPQQYYQKNNDQNSVPMPQGDFDRALKQHAKERKS